MNFLFFFFSSTTTTSPTSSSSTTKSLGKNIVNKQQRERDERFCMICGNNIIAHNQLEYEQHLLTHFSQLTELSDTMANGSMKLSSPSSSSSCKFLVCDLILSFTY